MYIAYVKMFHYGVKKDLFFTGTKRVVGGTVIAGTHDVKLAKQYKRMQDAKRIANRMREELGSDNCTSEDIHNYLSNSFIWNG